MKSTNEGFPLAIVGAGCRFAGADNLDAYWAQVRSQRCGLAEVPPSVLDQSLYYDPHKSKVGKTYSRIGGVVPANLLYADRIPAPREALAHADLAHLAFLDVVVEALDRAGWEADRLRGSRTGVYVGHARSSMLWGDMAFSTHVPNVLRQLEGLESWTRLDEGVRRAVAQQTLDLINSRHLSRDEALRRSVETGRVASFTAEVFGCNGPAVAIDAACASSFFALAQAANALRRGVVDQAIVGGASHSTWYSLVMFSQAQALSASGSFPFDERADGFVSSDGYAAILLKPLPKAVADGDRILGVIRGIGVSTDGRGKSLWAPRKEGQIAAIQRAYGADLDAASIGYVEAHGTSTRVGDATELEALSSELGRRLPPGRKIPVSSVKANIGHTRETAGLAGLLKTLMILRDGVVPAATGFVTPNPDIPWDRIPFFVPREEMAWADDGRVRRAAVDAFGIGGLNAHVVVDDRFEDTSRVSVAVTAPTADDDAVAVLGAGAILPGARTIDAFRKLITDKTPALCDVPTDRWNADVFRQLLPEDSARCLVKRAGFVRGFEYDWRGHQIPPKQVECADPLQFMLLDATDQAIVDTLKNGSRAKNDFLTPELRRRTSIVVGGILGGGDFSAQLGLALRVPEIQQALRGALAQAGVASDQAEAIVSAFAERYLQENRVLGDETGSYTSSTLASRLSKTLDMMGGAFVVDAGGASSAAALGCAFDQLLLHQTDMVVCAAGYRGLDVSVWEWLKVQGWLQPDANGGAHQSGVVGAVLGEGAGAVVLKRLSDARRDGDEILAILRGYGASVDPEPARAVRAAAEQAVRDAKVSAEEVVYVETSSTGVAHLEHAEDRGLQAVYAAGPRSTPLRVGSITPQIGFTQSTSGMAGLLRVATAFTQRRAADSNDTTELPRGSKPILVGLSSQALRPMAYHWLLQSPPPPVPKVKPEPTRLRIARFGATSAQGLGELLSTATSDPASAWQTATQSPFTPEQVHRLGIVAKDDAELGAKLTLAQSQLGNLAARPALEEQGIFVGEVGSRPRVAFVFSGQGSQYAGMFRELAAQSPLTARLLAEQDDEVRALSLPTLGELAWGSGAEELGRDLFPTQFSVLLADVLAFRVLLGMGLRPDVVTGHSFGEYPALVASGAWTLEAAARATQRRCEIIGACESARGPLLSTSASWAEAERISREVGGELFVANGNAPDQTVVGGRAADIERLAARLKSAGLEATILPVPAPFHTPLMADCQPPMRTLVSELALSPPSTPLLSSVTNRYVADPLDLRDNLVEQFVRPVRFVELAQRLAADGCNLLIEVGPRQILSRLLRRSLRSPEIAITSFDNQKRPGLEAVLRVQALFEVRGGVCASATQASSAPTARRAVSTEARSSTRPVFFDATTTRRERRPTVTVAAPAPSATNDAPADELQGVLVKFVCEQTGYPPEIVTMDADMEADLGIDSISKARLLGELREQFVFQKPAGSLSLADFPTLRHIYNFLKGSPRRTDKTAVSATPGVPEKTQQPAGGVEVSRVQQPAADARDPEAWERLNVAFFRGSPAEMGRQHGARERDAIRESLRAYSAHLGGKWQESPLLAEALERRREFLPPEGLDEVRGMAEACEVPVEQLLAFNFALGMERIAGCSRLAIPARHNGPYGSIHATNEDLALSLVLGERLRRVVQVRQPPAGIPHVLFSTSGQLGALNGFNAAGLCITSTLLLDRSTQGMPSPGWLHSLVVQNLLQQAENTTEAVRLLRTMRRCSAWSVCLSDTAADSLVYVEYDGDQLWEHTPTDGRFFSTNHSLLAEHLQPVLEGSRHRYERLEELFKSDGEGGRSAAAVQSMLSDVFDRERGRTVRHPTMNTIRRSDTHATIVMCPSADEVWVAQNGKPGHEEAREFTRLAMSDVFDIAADEDEPSRTMRRFVLRASEVPVPSGAPSAWKLSGRVMVLGTGRRAAELSRRLQADGHDVVSLPTTDAETALAEFKRLCAAGCPQSVLIAGDEPVTDELGVSRALTLYRVLQAWLSELPEAQLSRASLVALTSVGTDFGWTSPVLSHLGGGIAGLCKALHREFPAMRVRVIDTPAGEPASLVAAALQQELALEGDAVEVSWVRQRRRAVQALARQTRAVAGASPTEGGTWVVTGGARGITFAVARELARRYRLNLHLLGSSPPPQVDEAARRAFEASPKELRARTLREARERGADPNVTWKSLEHALEIDRNLRALQAEGLKATYHRCNVADGGALAQVVDAIRRSDGPIRGVMHGAGVEDASKFTRKRLERVEATLNVKVGGALHLIRLLAKDPLEHFIGFGSISGRFGNTGQSDYSMASDWLAKVVGRLRTERPSVRATTFHWPAWDEVGMAARPESRVVLEAAGSRFLPLAEGCRYVIDELEAGCPEAEVLIVEDGHHSFQGLPTVKESRARRAAERRAADFPMLAGVRSASTEQLVAEAVLDPANDVFLQEHQLAGVPILPGVVGMELMAEAASVLMRTTPVGLTDVEFVSGMRFDGRPQVVQVVARREGRRVKCEVVGDFFNRDGGLTDPRRVFVRGTVLFERDPLDAKTIGPPPDDAWRQRAYRSREDALAQASFYFGPSLQCMQETARSGDFLFSRLRALTPKALQGNRPGSRWLLPSVILDGCFHMPAIARHVGPATGLPLPNSLARVRWDRLPREGESCLCRAQLLERNDRHAFYAIELATTDGAVFLEVDRYCAVTLASPTTTDPVAPSSPTA